VGRACDGILKLIGQRSVIVTQSSHVIHDTRQEKMTLQKRVVTFGAIDGA